MYACVCVCASLMRAGQTWSCPKTNSGSKKISPPSLDKTAWSWSSRSARRWPTTTTHTHTCLDCCLNGLTLNCVSFQSAQKIFTSGYVVHGLVFFNSSVESQVAMVEESRSLAKKFKTKVMCLCLLVCVCVCRVSCVNVSPCVQSVVKLLLFCVQILFISIDVSQSLPNVLNYFGVTEDDAPTARIINMETGKKFNIATKKYTLEAMSKLCQEVVDGTAEVNYTCTRKHAHIKMYIANK